MIYTELTKKALRLAFDVHKEQVDKTGLPYIFHPFHLAEQMEDEATVCIALLHDVVEDGDVSFEDLREYGFTEEIISAIRLLTHDPAVPYMEYVAKVKTDPLAKKVKLADLAHNSDMSRLSVVDEWALIRYEKYRSAIALLNEQEEA